MKKIKRGRMKKILLGFLCFAALSLVGCGSSSKSESANPVAAVVTPSIPTKAEISANIVGTWRLDGMWENTSNGRKTVITLQETTYSASGTYEYYEEGYFVEEGKRTDMKAVRTGEYQVSDGKITHLKTVVTGVLTDPNTGERAPFNNVALNPTFSNIKFIDAEYFHEGPSESLSYFYRIEKPTTPKSYYDDTPVAVIPE